MLEFRLLVSDIGSAKGDATGNGHGVGGLMYLSLEHTERQSVVAASETPENADDSGGGYEQLAHITLALISLSRQKRLAVQELVESLI